MIRKPLHCNKWYQYRRNHMNAYRQHLKEKKRIHPPKV